MSRYPRLAATALLLLATILTACTTTQVAERPIDDALLDAKVLDVIRKNPAAVLEALQAHQREQQAAAQKAEEAALAARLAQLDLATVAAGAPTRGAPDGKLLLIEFSDFQCPFCARAQATIDGLMRKPRLELMLRTHRQLPADMRDEIEVVFLDGCTLAGLAGRIYFQAMDRFPVAPLEEIAKKDRGVVA